MIVSMMQLRQVRMAMGKRLVIVAMPMRFGTLAAIVWMPMMFIMHV